MRLGRFLLGLFLACLAGAAPIPAAAHPHILIDSHMVAQFENGKIVALLVGWKFDQFYSATLIEDFDKDKDHVLSPDEIADIEREAFQNTQPQSYFTYASIDGKAVTWPKATDFKVVALTDGIVYSFRLTLPVPVDPRAHAVRVSTYEETYYIDVAFPSPEAFRLTGAGSEGCRTAMGPDPDDALYGGLVIPQKIDIVCAAPSR